MLSYLRFLRDFIKESNRIEGIVLTAKELDEQRDLYEVFLSLPSVTLSDVQNFVEQIQPGAELRNRFGLNVRVGNHIPMPGGSKVESTLRALLESVSKAEVDPYHAHLLYEDLHPFMDGNGRSGRVVWAWQMVNQCDYDLSQLFLHEFYYQALANSH